MPPKPTHASRGEVLPEFTKRDADQLERKAVDLYHTLQRQSIQFAAYLRRLQDGNAHLLRGYNNFGRYCEHTFEGMTTVNAQALSRQGQVALVLERAGRISLEGKGENLPGTTGLRNLATIYKRYGEEVMLTIYDQAMASDRKVTAETIQAATAQLIKPEPIELEAGSNEEDEDENEQDIDTELPEKQRELIDRVRDLSWELPESLEELGQALKALEAETANKDASEDELWIQSKR